MFWKQAMSRVLAGTRDGLTLAITLPGKVSAKVSRV